MLDDFTRAPRYIAYCQAGCGNKVPHEYCGHALSRGWKYLGGKWWCPRCEAKKGASNDP